MAFRDRDSRCGFKPMNFYYSYSLEVQISNKLLRLALRRKLSGQYRGVGSEEKAEVRTLGQQIKLSS